MVCFIFLFNLLCLNSPLLGTTCRLLFKFVIRYLLGFWLMEFCCEYSGNTCVVVLQGVVVAGEGVVDVVVILDQMVQHKQQQLEIEQWVVLCCRVEERVVVCSVWILVKFADICGLCILLQIKYYGHAVLFL